MWAGCSGFWAHFKTLHFHKSNPPLLLLYIHLSRDAEFGRGRKLGLDLLPSSISGEFPYCAVVLPARYDSDYQAMAALILD
jgi:hypothetical protein